MCGRTVDALGRRTWSFLEASRKLARTSTHLSASGPSQYTSNNHVFMKSIARFSSFSRAYTCRLHSARTVKLSAKFTRFPSLRNMSSSNRPKASDESDSPNASIQQNITPSSQQPSTSPSSSTQPLPLPEPSKNDSTTKIDMSTGGSTVKLDHMGPLVVNKDGTLSRINNWGEMSEIEKQNTLRVLGKRNMLRREALEKEEQAGKE
jgi:hypothetical protein